MSARRIFLDAEYESSSLWWAEPHLRGMVDARALPLSAETIRRLTAWSQQLWDLLELDDEETGQPSPEERALQEEHDREGRALWLDVRTELGVDYEVGYAVYDPHPTDPYDAVRRIIWEPE
jgi:hypothetical protein